MVIHIMRLIKRKKGNKEYYYLQQSIRRGKRIVGYLYYRQQRGAEVAVYRAMEKFSGWGRDQPGIGVAR